MIVSSLTVGPFQENCYLLMDPVSRDAVLVDPGDEAERIVALVESAGATVQGIWLTHAHIDHINGIAGVLRRWKVGVHMHPADQPVFEAGAQVAAHYGLTFDPPPAPDHPLSEGQTLEVGSLSFNVIHVPGHAPGHVAFVGHGAVFGGDCLFAGTVGRTDLPLCDPAALRRSLARFAALPAETVVYAGHGPSTTIAEELATNPFLRGLPRREVA